MSIVLYGAGIVGERTYRLLQRFNIEVAFFVDSDKNKCKQLFCGKKVVSIEQFSKYHKKYSVIITASLRYYMEIKSILLSMGVPAEHIISKEVVLVENIRYQADSLRKGKQLIFLFDMGDGANFGGVETLTIQFMEGLKLRGYFTKAIFPSNLELIPKTLKNDIIPFALEEKVLSQKITEMVSTIINMLPCVIILSHVNYCFVAASIVKRCYPEMIKVNLMIHGGDMESMERAYQASSYLDVLLCVGDYIRKEMIYSYGINPDKVKYHPSPVKCDADYVRKECFNTGAIRIGYAGRIIVAQKRADLIPQLMEALVHRNVEFELHIAGEGPYLAELKQRVKKIDSLNQVYWYGRLEHSEMDKFWKSVDLFLNVSEFEGMSISMLEAMSFACVPVMTKVDGVEEFVQDGKNGFLCPIGEVNELADRIAYLSKDRSRLAELGREARAIIEKKCNLERYIDYLLHVNE